MKQALLVLLAALIAGAAGGCNLAQGEGAGIEAPRGARSPGKPQAPVELTHRLAAEPAVGEALVLELRYTPAVAAEKLSVRYRPSPGLLADEASLGRDFGAVAAGRSAPDRLSVIPQAEGSHYVSVFIAMTADGREQTRVIRLPLQVGAPPAADQPAGRASDGAGEAIISLPAAR